MCVVVGPASSPGCRYCLWFYGQQGNNAAALSMAQGSQITAWVKLLVCRQDAVLFCERKKAWTEPRDLDYSPIDGLIPLCCIVYYCSTLLL